jgi:hypothetical protein
VEFPNLTALANYAQTPPQYCTGGAANLVGRQNSLASNAATDATTGNSRYTDEVVNINLRQAAGPGHSLQPARPGTTH